MKLVGGTPEEIEARAELMRKKYGAMTINEILNRIVISTLIGYIVIALVVTLMYFSPIDERLLTSILLVFVLAEMLTEYALWAFTYQGMRKTEGPLADLQKFSSLTKEGWSRAELVMKVTTPFFKWIDDTAKRMGFGWSAQNDSSVAHEKPGLPAPPDPQIKDLIVAIRDLTAKLEEKDK
jgi:hypothetical protein